MIATASTKEKLAKAKELGADHLINYAETDFLEEVKRITNRKMVDVVFEHVGRGDLGEERRLPALRRAAGDLRRHHRVTT